jgi:hypothetical protein
MDTAPTDTFYKVVKMAQSILEEEERAQITPLLISEKVEMILAMKPSWKSGLDIGAVVEELVRRLSVWVGASAILKDDAGHEDWLTAGRKQDWRYWQRYRDWLEAKLPSAAIDELDDTTDAVLGLLEDPLREEPWDRRGLVVGHVQSGKTGNYTGLICKAADAGYKIIIVLAGLHNNLRAQTQIRLDEGFLGFETAPNPEDIRLVGVGEIDRDPRIRPNYATNRSDKGDFTPSATKNLGITPEQRPWLFVVKKNKTVLERLLRWVRNHVANMEDPETGRKLVTNLPLLMIDDEADHGSVDTDEQVFDENGQPDQEHEPTTINRMVRRILHTFTKSAYVGYTATPFANIFIHDRSTTREEGPDLFPAAFIINLGAPSSYVGPARVFGLNSGEARVNGLPLIRHVSDFVNPDGLAGWMPSKHRSSHIPLVEGRPAVPDSLREAIEAFVLACAIRALRGQGYQHSSMLVHVTRFTNVQRHVHAQVEEHVRHIRQRILRGVDDETLVSRLRHLLESDFHGTSQQIAAIDPTLEPSGMPAWEDVRRVLPEVLPDIQVRMINGTAKDALDYVEHSNTGLKVIAIGGDKLARGLTLEGLCVSYFLRSTKMYDTLMQMGRWFGYRPGYLDICRLYTTSELTEWFGHITDAAEELREEFDLMVASGGTPKQYGLKVQSHPVLMVTSRLKMRAAKSLMLSFSGQLLETVALFKDGTVLNRNLDAARRFLGSLDTPKPNPGRVWQGSQQSWTGYLWEDVSYADVADFLLAYRTHPDAYKVKSSLVAEFIQSMAKRGELVSWTVALIGGGQGRPEDFGDGVKVNTLKRKKKSVHENRYSIGRLLSPRDEAIDLDDAAWSAALNLTRQISKADPARLQDSKEPDFPSGPAIRKVKGFGAEGVPAQPNRGLLLLYALDPKEAEAGLPDDAPAVIAFGISFPGSDTGVKVEYKVNTVLVREWELEYGASE